MQFKKVLDKCNTEYYNINVPNKYHLSQHQKGAKT